MDILGKIMGSPARVKIMRLFLLNPMDGFENSDIVERSKVNASLVRKEVQLLNKVGFISKKTFSKEVPPRTKKGKPTRKRVSGWQLNHNFPLLRSFHTLIVNTAPLRNTEIINKFKKAGTIKLIVLSGIFIQEDESRIDLLVVGDKLKKGALENALEMIESEVGKELNYAFFETQDFKYRLGVYDKFIRDIFDYPHEKIIDRIGV